MKILKYCPSCGRESLQWEGEKKWSCPACHFNLYHNVAGAVAVVIRYEDELCLTRRERDPQRGKLDLAGGFIDPRESAEEACKRELYEELQIAVDESKLQYLASLPNIYRYKEIDYHTIDLFYEYRVPEKFGAALELSEISEALWIPLRELDLEELAFDSQKNFFSSYYLKNR